ncbi:MAG: thioredoxin family protein [Oscillospiraceae bacterium]|nr:thioredoxin family protein [Oscillospiraceae bacterium]
MRLFGKKKQEKAAGFPARSKTADGIRSIKVLGSGCKACHQLYDNTVKAADGTGIKVEYITDLQKIMEYGAMSMPALVINEKLVSSGKTLKPAEIIDLIKIAANN